MLIEGRLLFRTHVRLLITLGIGVVDSRLLFRLDHEFTGLVRTSLLRWLALVLFAIGRVGTINVAAIASGLRRLRHFIDCDILHQCL